jgi:hypothetical protein
MSNFRTLSTFFNRDFSLTRLVNALASETDTGYLFDDIYTNFYNIDTATTAWLDAWGVIVAMPRSVRLAGVDYFGFKDTPFTPFNHAPFYDGRPESSNFTMDNTLYRKAIKTKALFNRTGRNVTDINTALQFFMDANCHVIDNHDMSMTLSIPANWQGTDELAVLVSDAFMIRPAAVKVNIFFTDAPTYALIGNANSVNEGSSVGFTVTTTGFNGVLFYTVFNLTTNGSADLSPMSGSVVITGNTGTFSITALTDSLVDIDETFKVQLRVGSTSGVVVANSQTITIIDTPLQPFNPSFLYHLEALPLVDAVQPSTSLATFTTNTAIAYPSIDTGAFGNGLKMNFNYPNNNEPYFVITTDTPNNSNPDFTLRWRFKHPLHEGYENYFNIVGVGDGLSRVPSLPVYRFYSTNTTVLVHDNVWVAFSYEKKGGISYLYIDGVLAATTTVPLPTGGTLGFDFGVPISGNTPYYYDEIMFLAGVALANGASSYTVETNPFTPA